MWIRSGIMIYRPKGIRSAPSICLSLCSIWPIVPEIKFESLVNLLIRLPVSELNGTSVGCLYNYQLAVVVREDSAFVLQAQVF